MDRIKEVIELIELTGDKCVILHPDKGVYVLMKMEDYRQLALKNPVKTQLNRSLAMPSTDIRVYEIPPIRFKEQDQEQDQYYPEPLA